MQYVERTIENLDWITLTLVGCLLLFSIAKYAYPKRFQELLLLPISNKYFLVSGKNSDIQHPFNILLLATQVLSASLFILLFFRTSESYNINTTSTLFIQICTAYTVFVLCKYFIEKIIGSVFAIENLITNYLYQKLSYRNFFSVLFFIVNLFFYYVIEPSQIILLLFALVFIVCNAISLFYSYKSNSNVIFSNLFYFILYLCALEISPYIILYKVLV